MTRCAVSMASSRLLAQVAYARYRSGMLVQCHAELALAQFAVQSALFTGVEVVGKLTALLGDVNLSVADHPTYDAKSSISPLEDTGLLKPSAFAQH